MRLVVDLSTEYLKDRFCVPIHDVTHEMVQLVEEIHERYKKWHTFKVYEFQVFRTLDGNNPTPPAKEKEKICDFFNVAEDCSRERKVFCYVVESEKSIARRREDARRE